MSAYVLFNGVGFTVGLLLLDHGLRKRLPERADFIYVVLVLSVGMGWIGARGLYCLLNPSVPVLDGGFVFYGGLAAAVAFAAVIGSLCLTKPELLVAANAAVVPLLSAHAIGRVGCFFAGCCYGRYSPVLGFRHPTQLYEAVFLCALVGILVWLGEPFFSRRAALYLFGYPTFRFGIEFLRGDDRGEISSLSTSQCISIPALTLGLTLVFLCKRGESPQSCAF